MDVVFFGSGAFGLPTLKMLAAEQSLRAIVTQPDRPAGRGGALTPTPVGEWAAKNLPAAAIYKPEKVNKAEVVEQIRAHHADAWVVIAFGQKLGKALLDGKFAINLHASLLPRWRGAAPINAAILGGDAVTGNSIITLADRMDAGFVLGQSRRDIPPSMTAGELHDALAADGPDLMRAVLAQFAIGKTVQVTQDESKVMLAGKFSKADGFVDFSQSAGECRRRVHGLTPWPGVTVQWRSLPLKVLRAAEIESPGDEPPGTLVDAAAGIVRCGSRTALALIEVQPANGRAMTWREFGLGRKPTNGELLIGKTAAIPVATGGTPS